MTEWHITERVNGEVVSEKVVELPDLAAIMDRKRIAEQYTLNPGVISFPIMGKLINSLNDIPDLIATLEVERARVVQLEEAIKKTLRDVGRLEVAPNDIDEAFQREIIRQLRHTLLHPNPEPNHTAPTPAPVQE